MTEETHKKHLPIVAFLIVLLTLFSLDYQNETSGKDSFLIGSIISLINPGTITEDLLSKTSLKDQEIQSLDASSTLFDPYLDLPENITSRRYSIKNTSMIVSEVPVQNPTKIVSALLQQESGEYQFNKINPGTFYLNQTPPEKKTHNFLGIVINEILYGFQYLPQEHQKVLEIIDALQQNE